MIHFQLHYLRFFIYFCFFITIYFFQFFEIFYALLAASCWMPAGTKSGVNFNWHGSLQFPHILSYPVSDLSWPLPVLIQIHRRSSTAASTQISRGGRPAISRNFCFEQFQIHSLIYFYVDTKIFSWNYLHLPLPEFCCNLQQFLIPQTIPIFELLCTKINLENLFGTSCH